MWQPQCISPIPPSKAPSEIFATDLTCIARQALADSLGSVLVGELFSDESSGVKVSLEHNHLRLIPASLQHFL